MIRGQVWTIHGLECDDGEKLDPAELVLKSDYDDERKSNDALMGLLAKEKRKNEQANEYALTLVTSLAKRFPAVDAWLPLSDLIGKLTQIDNMTALLPSGYGSTSDAASKSADAGGLDQG